MTRAADNVFHDYLHVLERVIIDLRFRIRYGDSVPVEEVHDLMDAIHNIPEMLRNCEGWHVPDNIDADLKHYDNKWLKMNDGVEYRKSLVLHLELARAGEYDR